MYKRQPNDRLPDYIKAMSTDTAFTTGAYKYCKIAQNRTDGKFRPFWPKSKRRAKPHTWGYDAITYYWLEQLWQEPFYVIKWAIGGTSIEPSASSDKSVHWSANPEWLSGNVATSQKGRSLLLSFINDIDGCIDNTLSKLKNGYRIDAFLWHQGCLLYTSTANGSYLLDIPTGKLSRYSDLNIKNGAVTKDNKKNVWVHNYTGHLWYVDVTTGNIKPFQFLSSEHIGYIDVERYSIVHDSRDIIWITTYGNGLYARCV